MSYDDEISIRNAKILYPNFEGRKTDKNPPGQRNFCLVLEQGLADRLAKEGWNIRQTKIHEEGDIPDLYTQIRVNFDPERRPPTVVLIDAVGRKIKLDASSCHILDTAEIKKVDVVINPHHWNMNGNSGIKGYLKSIYVTLRPEDFGGEYSDVPSFPANGV